MVFHVTVSWPLVLCLFLLYISVTRLVSNAAFVARRFSFGFRVPRASDCLSTAKTPGIDVKAIVFQKRTF